jgi:hypothetical protein
MPTTQGNDNDGSERLDGAKTDCVILRCAGGGCCPAATFLPDGSIEISEFGQRVTMTEASARVLLVELTRRGYGT